MAFVRHAHSLATALPAMLRVYSNIQPIRAVLEAKPIKNGSGLFCSIFPYIPWRPSSKVAIEPRGGISSPAWSRRSELHVLDADLEGILNFPPLLLAFDDFCHKALCGESLEFLMEVRNFEKALRTTAARSGNEEFDTLMGIVDKFIKSNSPFEVNIDDQTRGKVLAKAATYKEFPLEEKIHVLDLAKHEIGKMLQENLLHKFRATEQFKHINDVLISSSSASKTSIHAH